MKLKQKIITAFTTTILLGSYLLPVGNLAIATATAELESQTSKTNNPNVEFNTYLEGNTHENTYNLTEGGKLYIELKVKENGYLKNGIVEFSNCNYNFNSNEINSEYIQKIENNAIYLKQISNEDSIRIELPISFKKEEAINIEEFNKESKAKLKGSYINIEGKEILIEKEITNKLKWEAEAEAKVNAEITKYIPYKLGEEYGLLLQTKINSGINENILPIASTSLEVSVPVINNKKADVVKVIANKTIATNGEESGLNFTSENYEYNENENKVKINVNNKVNTQGNMAWKNGEDEYLITCIYKEKEIYDYVKEQLEKANSTKITEEQIANGENNINAINMPTQVNGIITVYGIEQKQIQVNSSFSSIIQEEKGELSDSTVKTINNISKGYIYANYAKEENEKQVEEKEQTIYELTYNAQIYSTDILKEIKFITEEEKIFAENTEYEIGKNIITKEVKINEAIFKKILGEEGNLQVLDKSNNVLGEINSLSQKDDQGNYILNIEEKNINEVIVKASNPITEGSLEVKVEKAFVENQSFSQEQMKTFTKILITSNIETNTNNKNYNMEITLQEPVSKAEIKVEEEKQTLSTVVVNKDVNINVVLDTSSVQNALYKNPVIKIVMPSEIKKVDLKDANLLLDDELKIENKKVTTENGKQIINITLKGTQTEYENYSDIEQNNVITKGANIILKADLTLDMLASSQTEKIYMYYTNENTNLYENVNNEDLNKIYGIATTDIDISAPTGVILASGISNYSSKAQEIISISDINATIETYVEKRIATIYGKVINNHKNEITDVVILGRIPAKNNIKIDEEDELGSNFSTYLNSPIVVSGINKENYEIYYSDKANATKNLEDNSNGWKEESNTSSKSYLIVIKNYNMQKGKEIDFEYNVEIPEKLSYNNNSYGMYKVYYNNVSEIGTIAETKTSPIINISTGDGPKLDIKLSSMSDTVREGQIVKIIATIKNVGEMAAENAKLIIDAPDGTSHIQMNANNASYVESKEKKKEISLGTINPGQTIVKEYELKIEKGVKSQTIHDDSTGKDITTQINEYPGDKDLQNIVKISSSNITNEIESDPYILHVKEGDISIIVKELLTKGNVLKKGDNLKYEVNVSNISYTKDAENLTLNVRLPEGIKINDIYYQKEGLGEKVKDNITINGNTATINIGTLKSINKYLSNLGEITEGTKIDNICTMAYVYIECTVESFQGEQNFAIEAVADEILTHYSNIQNIKAEEVKLTIEQDELNQKYIKEGSEYITHFKVKNIGEIVSTKNEINMVLPEGLSFVKVQYKYGDQEVEKQISKEDSLNVSIHELEAGQTIDIYVTLKAKLLSNTNSKEVITVATLKADGFEKIESNSQTAIIEYDETVHNSSENGGAIQNSYKITGMAWLDKDQDGKRASDEQVLSGIQVILLNKKDNTIVKTQDTGENVRTITKDDGTYEFVNIPKGEYLVLFLYDTKLYGLTSYKASGVSESINSDAASINVILNGEEIVAGITDTIEIKNSNIMNIDIGLYSYQKFDLKLDKYISKITRTTPTSGTTTTTYTPEKGKVAKSEILSKNLGESNVIIEYKIVVTNEGTVSGYVKKIVDYLPKNVRFSTTLNKDWYLSEKGNIYNASLENEEIKPGESKEVTLVVTAVITNSNLGILTNNAEIYESYNKQGLPDIDSKSGNNMANEDDISNADLVLSLTTGRVATYMILLIGIIVLIAFGAFLINRFILTEKEEEW